MPGIEIQANVLLREGRDVRRAGERQSVLIADRSCCSPWRCFVRRTACPAGLCPGHGADVHWFFDGDAGNGHRFVGRWLPRIRGLIGLPIPLWELAQT